MLSQSPLSDADEGTAFDADAASAALSDSLVTSRELVRHSKTLLALAQCPGPALHDPIDD